MGTGQGTHNLLRECQICVSESPRACEHPAQAPKLVRGLKLLWHTRRTTRAERLDYHFIRDLLTLSSREQKWWSRPHEPSALSAALVSVYAIAASNRLVEVLSVMILNCRRRALNHLCHYTTYFFADSASVDLSLREQM